MKKIIGILLGVIMGLCFMSNIVFASEKVVLIDAGHGGIDGGAVSKDGVVEKDINLAIALALKQSLEEAGYKVHMTRETDCGLYTEGKTIKQKKTEDLANRSKMKTETNADVFISIHQNMFSEPKYKGMQVWYTANSKESKDLANIIQNTAKEKIDPSNNRAPKDAGTQFRVLRNRNNAACVIVECGFLSNPEECKLLTEKEYQEKFAQMLKESVDNYYKNRSSVDN